MLARSLAALLSIVSLDGAAAALGQVCANANDFRASYGFSAVCGGGLVELSEVRMRTVVGCCAHGAAGGWLGEHVAPCWTLGCPPAQLRSCMRTPVQSRHAPILH